MRSGPSIPLGVTVGSDGAVAGCVVDWSGAATVRIIAICARVDVIWLSLTVLAIRYSAFFRLTLRRSSGKSRVPKRVNTLKMIGSSSRVTVSRSMVCGINKKSIEV